MYNVLIFNKEFLKKVRKYLAESGILPIFTM